MKIILTFSDDEAARLRWLLAKRYPGMAASLNKMAAQAIREAASDQAKIMIAEIDSELRAEFAKVEK